MEVKLQTATEIELARVGFNRDGKSGLIDPRFTAVRGMKGGEIRYHVTVPNAERLVFPDDLGVLLQCFGWGVAALDQKTRAHPFAVWHGCCEVIGKLEHCLKLF